MNKTHQILSTVTAVTLLLGASSAFANEERKGMGIPHDRYQVHTKVVQYTQDPDHVIKIYDNDRVVLQKYTEDRFYQTCPPGIASKLNGCVPPAEVKRTYVVGKPLSRQVTYYTVPQDVVVRLQPIPRGYEYVRVDNDILLINQGDRMIADAVTWMPTAR